jgi:hypothetical protein
MPAKQTVVYSVEYINDPEGASLWFTLLVKASKYYLLSHLKNPMD